MCRCSWPLLQTCAVTPTGCLCRWLASFAVCVMSSIRLWTCCPTVNAQSPCAAGGFPASDLKGARAMATTSKKGQHRGGKWSWTDEERQTLIERSGEFDQAL